MENLKKEAIKKAYGESWEQVKDYVDDNGVCKWDYNNCSPSRFNIKDFDKMGATVNNQFYWRPKSIRGIEKNNGWIRIQNKKDLPKKEDNYYVIVHGDIQEGMYIGNDRWFLRHNDYPKTTELHGITHYQKIIRLQPPIY
jgi:hypothetical protein